MSDPARGASPEAGAPPRGGARLLALALLFNNGVFYGLLFSINRVAMTEAVPPGAYVAWQGLGAGALLLLLGALFGRLPKLSGAHLRSYFAVGLSGFVVTWGISALVAPRIPVGVFAIIISLIPILTYALVLGFRLERFRWPRMAGLALGFAGVLLLLVPEASLPRRDMVGWALLALGAPLGLAFSTVWMQTLRPPATSSTGMAAGVLLAAGLCALPFTALAGQWWFFDGPWGAGHWAVIGAIVVVAMIWGLAYEIVRLAGPFFLSFVDYIAMLTGIGWGILIFGERHSDWIWGAVALMLAAVYLVNRTGPRTRRRGPA